MNAIKQRVDGLKIVSSKRDNEPTRRSVDRHDSAVSYVALPSLLEKTFCK